MRSVCTFEPPTLRPAMTLEMMIPDSPNRRRAGRRGEGVTASAKESERAKFADTDGVWPFLRHNKDVTHAITRDSEIMHGVPVFRGTRVPVQTLFEYLEGGDTLEDFLAGFPTVSRDVALQALEEAKQLLLARA